MLRLLASLSLSLLLLACSEDAPRLQPVELQGRILVPEGLEGQLEVRLYHAWSLTGELRHPLEFITAFQPQGPEFTHRFDYPLDGGAGLVVYAWMDVDGDGVLCTPAERRDLAGLVAVAELGDGRLQLAVPLSDACRGPEWFFPRPL